MQGMVVGHNAFPSPLAAQGCRAKGTGRTEEDSPRAKHPSQQGSWDSLAPLCPLFLLASWGDV